MTDDTIFVIDAASDLGRGKQTVFKVLARLGISPIKRRDPSRRNQLAACITQAEFDRVRQELLVRPQRRSEVDAAELGNDGFISTEVGVFYLIQLEPEFDPQRIKVGFTSNIAERLRTLRCAAHQAQVIESWPCRRLWEKTAIDSVTQGCNQLHTEVFRAPTIDVVRSACQAFFSLMPPA